MRIFGAGIGFYAIAFWMNSDDLLLWGFCCELLAVVCYLASL